MREMAAAACVSASCCSVSGARESYGKQHQQQGQNGGQKQPLRSAFCGEKISSSLRTQQWLPTKETRHRGIKGPLTISSVLAEFNQTTVSTCFQPQEAGKALQFREVHSLVQCFEKFPLRGWSTVLHAFVGI